MAQLSKLQSKKSLYVVGVMNGTSIDACDFVLCRVKRFGRGRTSIEQMDALTFRFPSPLRKRLLSAASNKQSALMDIARLHHDLGHFYAKCALKAKYQRGWKPQLYSIHGQTVYHEGRKATLQIGEASYVAQALALPVVSDFRSSDIASGGQGAPFAPVLHSALAEALKGPICFQNLGGIGNVTYIESKNQVAFDTGPANILIDAWVSKHTNKSFDRDGKTAARGLADPTVLKELLSRPYFKKRPPKSCGREEFGEEFLDDFQDLASELSFADQLATLTELSAKSIELAYRKFLPQLPHELYLCGGGAYNKYLIKRLRLLLPETQVMTTAELGWPVENIEGGAFALLGARCLWEIKTDFRAITGSNSPRVLGKISLG